MSLDPNKTYLVWSGTEFPNTPYAKFKAPAGSMIDWGDGTVETFDTASTTVNTHTYTDGKTEHIITISGLKSIGSSAFEGCSSLTNVTIGNSVTSIGDYAFGHCKSLTSMMIPNSITSISDYAFYYCSKLLNITIPDSVKSIGSSAFEGCSSLTSITIPDSVTSIGDGLLMDCSNLLSVTIGNGITSIPMIAFYGCTKLAQLVLFPLAPPTLGSGSGAIPTTISKIYVQQSSKAAYQTATNWKTFASKIVSDNMYLSFVRFNQKNKEYIDAKIDKLKQYIDNKIAELTSNNV